MTRNKTIRQTPARAKNVHAFAQRDVYVTGLYSSGISLGREGLNDMRLEWVDRPENVSLNNHRFLSKCACQLAMMTAVMRDYSRLCSKIEGSLLDAILEYGLKAHNVYSHVLRRWLERNPKSFAREKVQELISNYPKREKESLHWYYKRTCRELEDRWDHLAGCHTLVHLHNQEFLSYLHEP